MSDIVERLATARNMIELERAASMQILNDAADEIERLTKQLQDAVVDAEIIQMAQLKAEEEIEQLRERLRLQEMGARSLVDILENEIQQLRGGRTTSGASGRCLAMSNDSKGRGQIATPLPGRMEHAGMSDVVVWLRRVAEGTAGVLYAESGDDGVKVREMWHPTDLFPVADEIERLRKATKKQANMIVDQEAEIEQLRDEAALRIDYKQMARGLEDRLREQANEIERLRGLLREALEEITRLRAALVSIARAPGADNETAYEMRKIAQEALGNE